MVVLRPNPKGALVARHAKKNHTVKLPGGVTVDVGQGPPQVVVEPSAMPPSTSPPPEVVIPPGGSAVPGTVMVDTLSLTQGLSVHMSDGANWHVARIRAARDGGRTVTLRRPGVKLPVSVPRDGLTAKMWRTGG